MRWRRSLGLLAALAALALARLLLVDSPHASQLLPRPTDGLRTAAVVLRNASSSSVCCIRQHAGGRLCSGCSTPSCEAVQAAPGTVSDCGAASAFNTPWRWLRAVRCSQAPGRRAACIGLASELAAVLGGRDVTPCWARCPWEPLLLRFASLHVTRCKVGLGRARKRCRRCA
jgi:hypothetical protein